jgi:hypothetical protein
MAVWSMSIACWIPKAKITPSEYAIYHCFSTATMIYERASMLRYTFIALLLGIL